MEEAQHDLMVGFRERGVDLASLDDEQRKAITDRLIVGDPDTVGEPEAPNPPRPERAQRDKHHRPNPINTSTRNCSAPWLVPAVAQTVVTHMVSPWGSEAVMFGSLGP